MSLVPGGRGKVRWMAFLSLQPSRAKPNPTTNYSSFINITTTTMMMMLRQLARADLPAQLRGKASRLQPGTAAFFANLDPSCGLPSDWLDAEVRASRASTVRRPWRSERAGDGVAAICNNLDQTRFDSAHVGDHCSGSIHASSVLVSAEKSERSFNFLLVTASLS